MKPPGPDLILQGNFWWDSFSLCTPYWSAQIFLFLHVQPFLIEWIEFCFYDSVLVGTRKMGEWGDIGQRVQSFSYV